MKILESSVSCENNINHMMDTIEEAVDMLNNAEDLNDEKLEKAVRVMYNGADEVMDRLMTMNNSAEESKEPVTEGYIEDRYLEVIKICNGTIDVAEYFGPNMNSVNNIRAGIVAIRNDLRTLKSGITGAAEQECKMSIKAEVELLNNNIGNIDKMIAQLERFKAQAIEAALEAKKVTAKVVVPR